MLDLRRADLELWQHVYIKHVNESSANTKQLYNICTTTAQRWLNIVQMLYKY